MVGAGDEDHIITRVIPGTDPLQEFDEDDPTDVITIDHETDELDADDLSEVSMTSADTMTKDTRGKDAGEVGETPQIQSRNSGSQRHPTLPKEYSTPYPQAAFPEVGEGDCPRLQDRFTIPVSGNTMSSGSSRGLSCGAVRRHQPVCHPCKASHHHAQGHPVGQTNPGRASIVSHNHKQTFRSFSGPPQYSKRSSLRKAIRTCESLLQNRPI